MGQDLSLKVVLSASDQASGKLKGFGSTLVNLAGDAGPLLGGLLAVSAVVVGIGVKATQMAADYQQQMNMVQALTGSNATQMAYYDTQVKQLAVDAGVAPTALAKGLYNVLSASYSGADAMKILTLATEDSKIGMTDAATTSNALTNVLRTFGTATSQATRVNGEMLETVTLGKSTFSQYASSITKAASTSKQFGQNMETMNAAWSTLTSTGISAGQATTDYDQLLGVMYSSIGTVSKSLNKNGIAFNEAKFNAMDFGDKVQYLNQVLTEANDKHVKITGATKQASQALQALASHTDMYNSNLKTLSNQTEMNNKTASAWATTQGGFNQTMSRLNATVQVFMIDLGQQLLPILTQIASAVIPLVTNFTNFTMALFNNQTAMDILKGALLGFVVVLLAILIPALWTWIGVMATAALATLAATWPILAIGAAIAGLAAIVLAAYDNCKPFRDFINSLGKAFQNAWAAIQPGTPIFNTVAGFMQQLGNFIAAQFLPLWQQLVNLWNQQLLPAFKQMQPALQQMVPLFELLGGIIGGLIVVTIGILIGLISGLARGLSWFIQGLAIAVAGLVKVFGGIVQVVGGVVQLIVDLIHGNFTGVEKDLGQIGQGILNIFIGLWQTAAGIFLAAGGLISGIISGFIQGVINFFSHLADVLVGHSIIPDMITNIINWFKGLPGTVAKIGQDMITGLSNVIKNGATTLLQDAKNMASSVAGGIAQFLHFSKPETGPLATIDQWMPHFGDQLSAGMKAQLPKIQASASVLAYGVAGAGSVPYGRPPAGNSYNNSSGNVHNGDIVIHAPAGSNPDQIAKAVMDKLNQQYRRSGLMSNLASGGRSS